MNHFVKNRFFYGVIFLLILINNYQTHIFGMKCSSAFNTETGSQLFFKHMQFLYSTYFMPEIVFNNATIVQEDLKTIMTIEHLKTIQLFLSINKQYYAMFKSVYIDLLRKLLHTCCYDKKYYGYEQNINKRISQKDNINYFDKRVSRNSMEILAYVLSSNTKQSDMNKIVADIATYSEANAYVKHNIQVIITQIDHYYQSIVSPTAKDRLLGENKQSIYQNNLTSLIKNNSSTLLLFIKKLFDYSQYKNYTMLIRTDYPFKSLPDGFISTYKEHNFKVGLLSLGTLALGSDTLTQELYLSIKRIVN